MPISAPQALRKLLDGTARGEEINLLKELLASGEITIGGGVGDSIIVMGDKNSVEISPEMLEILTDASPSVTSKNSYLEEAILHYQEALKVATPESQPILWAQIQFELGKAYANRLIGDRRSNLDHAIDCFQNALRIYDRKLLPEQWANTQLYLGKVYAALAGDSTTEAPPPPKKKKDK
jgi:tetratricopeptide (TPR) repeat protein